MYTRVLVEGEDKNVSYSPDFNTHSSSSSSSSSPPPPSPPYTPFPPRSYLHSNPNQLQDKQVI